MNLESKMSKVLHRLGLQGWTCMWEPDPSEPKRGRVFPEARDIIVYDEEPDAALETLIHEALEIKMRSVLVSYREIVNALIDAFEKVTYYQKERLIDELTQYLFHVVGKDAPQPDGPQQSRAEARDR